MEEIMIKEDLKGHGAQLFALCASVAHQGGGDKGNFSRLNCIIYLIYLERTAAPGPLGKRTSFQRRATKAIGLAVLCDAIFVVVASWKCFLARRPSLPYLFMKRKYLKRRE